MKDFNFSVLYAIVRDMVGIDPWIFIGLAVLVLLGFVFSLARHGLRGPQLQTAAISGMVGGLIAIGAAPILTSATFENLSGPLDWLSLVLIGFCAGTGIAVLLFGILGLAKPADGRL